MKSGSVIPPTLISISKFVLAFYILILFYDVTITLSIYTLPKIPSWILIGIVLNLNMDLERIHILTVSSLLNYEQCMFLLLLVFLWFLSAIFCVLSVHISFARFFLKIFYIFEAMLNENISNYSLLVDSNTIDFCTLLFCLAILLNLIISSNSCFVESSNIFIYMIMTSANKSICNAFSWMIAETRLPV